LAAETPLQRLEQLAGRPGVSKDLLDLEAALLAWRQSLEADLRAHYPQTQPDPATLQAALRDPDCLAARIDPLPQPALLARAATTLTEILRDRTSAGTDLHAWLADAHGDESARSGSRQSTLAAWFNAAWHRDWLGLGVLASAAAHGAPGGLDVEVLEWSGRQLCRPFFHRLGELLAEAAIGATEARATCPSCGGPPRFGRLARDDGRRFLWCDLCNIQWPFRRLTCAFCGNTQQTKLGYLSIEEDPHHRIDVCEGCRCYLRAVDERGLPEGQHVSFWIEDLGTMQLCMAAEGQGYRPGDGKPAAGLQREG